MAPPSPAPANPTPGPSGTGGHTPAAPPAAVSTLPPTPAAVPPPPARPRCRRNPALRVELVHVVPRDAGHAGHAAPAVRDISDDEAPAPAPKSRLEQATELLSRGGDSPQDPSRAMVSAEGTIELLPEAAMGYLLHVLAETPAASTSNDIARLGRMITDCSTAAALSSLEGPSEDKCRALHYRATTRASLGTCYKISIFWSATQRAPPLARTWRHLSAHRVPCRAPCRRPRRRAARCEAGRGQRRRRRQRPRAAPAGGAL